MPAVLPLLCAGQECNQRRECMRFKLRGPAARYASFDIEHKKLDGERACPSFEQYRPQNKVALHRR